jgi:S-adenosylmethionine hydrolase
MAVIRSGIVTLTTDFGTEGSYVGAVRGAVLTAWPAANVVDITHEVSPQDVLSAARIIRDVCPVYPAGTVHLVVVDPGVGTERQGVALRAGQHLFVGPDNGIFDLISHQLGDAQAYVIGNRLLMAKEVSATFHARDVFGPVAGHLASGMPITDVGPPLANMVALTGCEEPRLEAGRVVGQVVRVDHFGNLVTNIHRSKLPSGPLSIACETITIKELVRTYGESDNERDVIALIGSDGYVELAVRNGSASRALGKGEGTRVVVEGATE